MTSAGAGLTGEGASWAVASWQRETHVEIAGRDREAPARELRRQLARLGKKLVREQALPPERYREELRRGARRTSSLFSHCYDFPRGIAPEVSGIVEET